ncbi:hypothetical protein Drorol1_Dr00021825 [Drosera rotundifolia]
MREALQYSKKDKPKKKTTSWIEDGRQDGDLDRDYKRGAITRTERGLPTGEGKNWPVGGKQKPVELPHHIQKQHQSIKENNPSNLRRHHPWVSPAAQPSSLCISRSAVTD